MKNRDVKRVRMLRNILSVQSESGEEGRVRQSIMMRLENIKKSLPEKEQANFDVYQKEGNIFVTRGKINKKQKYPCVVSHTDTVHSFHKSFAVKEHNGWLFAFGGEEVEQKGIGGDDKVGVFITLEMIAQHKVIKAAFFAEEEIGLVGSSRAPASFFEDCGFALQCDRKGNKDFVNEINNVKLYSDEFSNEIEPILKQFGYKETSGGSTDVTNVKKKADICVANMSCGYFDPHSDSEVVHITSVFRCSDMVSAIITQCGKKAWRHKYKDEPIRLWENQSSMYGMYGSKYFSSYGENQEKRKQEQASLYLREAKEEEEIIQDDFEEKELFCPKCLKDDRPVDALHKLTEHGKYWCEGCWREIDTPDAIEKNNGTFCKCDMGKQFTSWDTIEQKFFCINCENYLKANPYYNQKDNEFDY